MVVRPSPALPILLNPLEPRLAHAVGTGALHIGNGTGLRRTIPDGVLVLWRYRFKGAGGQGGEAPTAIRETPSVT